MEDPKDEREAMGRGIEVIVTIALIILAALYVAPPMNEFFKGLFEPIVRFVLSPF